jgi:hypothetical protein
MTRLAVALAALAALAAGACASSQHVAPRVLTRPGPAFDRAPRRVLALPPTCGSLSGTLTIAGDQMYEGEPVCEAGPLATVASLLRGRLEFVGYGIVDAEQVRAATAARTETTTTTVEDGVGVAPRPIERSSTRTERAGAVFTDATPAEQRALIGALGVAGVLTTRVWISANASMLGRRTVEVQVRLADPAGRLVWASRCAVEADVWSDGEAMSRAGRCAIDGALAL